MTRLLIAGLMSLMILRAQLPIKGDRIDYSYDTERDQHAVIFAMSCDSYTGTKGSIASVIAPYRNHRCVSELFTWLTI